MLFNKGIHSQNIKMKKSMQLMLKRFIIIFIFQVAKTISQNTTVNKGIMK